MNLFVSKITSLLLALLVLFSTLSFTVGTHYCGNIMIDKAILSKAQTCEMHQEMPSEEKSECCGDEVEIIEGQDVLQFSKAEFDLDIPVEFAIFSLIHFSSTGFFAKEIATAEVYDPPHYYQDFQILHQVFLI
ncbi:HYC_CC_PP family protein [Psychroflexus curvus]|uniref:HYC_CC_PP family protein n=1 Tax=Psychroflexus curvus TaxID=2873595 RepID=UPI003899E3E9